MSDGLEVAATRTRDAIPKELHGFRVTVGLGPYPPEAERSHRRAMYARLTPVSRHAQRIMRRMGRQEIVGHVQLTAEGAADCELDPQGPTAEQAALLALAPASRIARDVARSR